MNIESVSRWRVALAVLFIGMTLDATSAAAELISAHYGETRIGKSYWTATLQTRRFWDGREHSTLELTYSRVGAGAMPLCVPTSVGPRPVSVEAVLVLGEGSSTTSITLPMSVTCQKWHTDDPSDYRFPRASLQLTSSDEALWNRIFPPDEQGNRWYALQLAAKIAEDESGWGMRWDSNFGQNYPLILEPTP